MARPTAPNQGLPKFTKWSQSEFGFYPGTRYYKQSGLWKESRQPIIWSPALARLFDWLFHFDSRGQMPVDTFFFVDVAKSGKTMLGAAVAQYFGTFVDAGIPGEIIIAANSKDHAGVRTYGTLQRALMRHPYVDEIVVGGRNGIMDSGITFRDTGHTVRAVPKKADTQAGTDAVLIDFDEGWKLRTEEDSAWIAEMKASRTRNTSFRLHHTYTGYYGDGGYLTEVIGQFYGEDGLPKVAAAQVGGLEDLPLLQIGRTGLWWNHNPKLYEWWTDNEIAKARDDEYRLIPNEFRRHVYAEIVQSENALIPPVIWHRCTDPDWTGADPKRGRREVMVGGLDLGAVHDSSACIWRSYDPDTKRLPLMAHKVWHPKDYRQEATGYILNEVKEHILDMHRKHKVVAVYYDASQALYMVNELIKAGVKMVEIKQVKGREATDTMYRQAIYDQRLRNYPYAGELTEHVLAAVAKTMNDDTIRIRKDKSAKRIDACVADAMCVFGVEQEKQILTSLHKNGGESGWKPKPSIWAVGAK